MKNPLAFFFKKKYFTKCKTLVDQLIGILQSCKVK
jgi:hypothetical protein